MLCVLQAETARRREVEQQLKLTKMQLVGAAAAAAAAVTCHMATDLIVCHSCYPALLHMCMLPVVSGSVHTCMAVSSALVAPAISMCLLHSLMSTCCVPAACCMLCLLPDLPVAPGACRGVRAHQPVMMCGSASRSWAQTSQVREV
jgi:hypothetical protein